ncbi:hypothetical protein DJ70_06195 [Halorubrum halodurans]|uniref:Uncharacterized protein n=1 Tax=Halorubrum halodurans TaxID=1383851 RepID=A0A256IM26_9EURY|nr:hypothetical protein DJ70_06195 [Halorubrum halodurans]
MRSPSSATLPADRDVVTGSDRGEFDGSTRAIRTLRRSDRRERPDAFRGTLPKTPGAAIDGRPARR